MERRLNILWVTNGLSDNQDLLSKNWQEMFLWSQVKESLTLCSLQFWEELVLFLVLLVAEKHVFLKPCPNIQTVRLLSTSDVEREEMKWLRCWNSSLNWQLLKTERKYLSCKEHLLWLILQICLWLLDRLVSILVSLWQNISEIWVETYPWWLTQLLDGQKHSDKYQVVWQKCLEIQDIQLIWQQN